MFNLMLAQSGIKVCTSFDDLDKYLESCSLGGGLIFEPYYGTIE
jgi:hypothetical protein